MNSIETKLWGANIMAEEGSDFVALTMTSNSTGNASATAHMPKADVIEFTNGLLELSQQLANPKHLENIRQIEGIYQGICQVKGIKDVMMVTGTYEVWFENEKGGKSQVLSRDILESKTLVELADQIIWSMSEICNIHLKLPSRHQIGDAVRVNMPPYFTIDSAEIIKVHFSEGKVMYDLIVDFQYDDVKAFDKEGNATGIVKKTGHTRVYNIDSVFVEPKNLPDLSEEKVK